MQSRAKGGREDEADVRPPLSLDIGGSLRPKCPASFSDRKDEEKFLFSSEATKSLRSFSSSQPHRFGQVSNPELLMDPRAHQLEI
jgi:hypothetical protein